MLLKINTLMFVIKNLFISKLSNFYKTGRQAIITISERIIYLVLTMLLKTYFGDKSGRNGSAARSDHKPTQIFIVFV